MILIFAKWLLVYVLEHKRNFHVIIIFHYKDCGFFKPVCCKPIELLKTFVLCSITQGAAHEFALGISSSHCSPQQRNTGAHLSWEPSSDLGWLSTHPSGWSMNGPLTATAPIMKRER